LELLEVLLNSGVLIPGLALCFGLYIAYILLSAKNIVPMNEEEAESLWKFHRATKCCGGEKWQKITKRNKLIGFECECGYKHVQKKPLITVG
jgi:hypothetical protein